MIAFYCGVDIGEEEEEEHIRRISITNYMDKR
jgi:hypothetical protein